MQYMVQSQEQKQNILKQNIQYHSNPSLSPDQKHERAEVEQFYENLQ